MKRILIVEDDALIARVYSTKYQSAGFETAVAVDGEEGLELIGKFKPDLVHLDLSVPKVNGAEVIKRVRAQEALRSLPIVVLSNTYQNRLVKAAMDAGASECVSKATCTPKMMVEIVEKIWARLEAAERAERVREVRGAAPSPTSEIAQFAANEHELTTAPASASAPALAAALPVTATAPELPTATAPAPASVAETPAVPPDSESASPSDLWTEVPVFAPTNPTPRGAVLPLQYTTETQKHAEFQAEIQREFVKRAPRYLAALRERVEPLLRAETTEIRILELTELGRLADSFAGRAGLADFPRLAQMSMALAALLKEMIENPQAATASALRTIVDATEFLSSLLERAGDPSAEPVAPPVVLVVDDETLSRRAVCLALARLNVATINVEDPRMALRLLAENRFGLIFLDVDMPGISGFDVCRELRTLQANRATPVVFVSTMADDAARDKVASVGGNDLIAKPFLPMELAVKALSLLQ